MSAQADREVLAYAFDGPRKVAVAYDEGIVEDWQRSEVYDVELTELGEQRMRGFDDDERRYRTDKPSGLPPGFQTWPRADQLKHLTMRKKRRDLMVHLLSRAGFTIDEMQPLDHDRKLTKKELAGIYLVLEGLN